MNYTYVENVETSAYTLTVTTDTDLLPLISSDNFEIGIFDEINGQNTVINKNNFQLFGINDKNPDLDSRLENSLIKNKGLLVYIDSSKVLQLKMLINCSNGEETIGYNSSKITLWLDDKTNLTTYACILPKLLRDNSIIQYDANVPDPVLSEPNLRQAYNYDTDVNAQLHGLVTPIIYDYSCGDINSIYVNTDISVPVYCNTVSALLRNKDANCSINITSVSSFLYDDTDNTLINIPYEKNGPFETQLNINDTYTANIEYYTYTQFLSAAGNNLYKNNLHLLLSTSAVSDV